MNNEDLVQLRELFRKKFREKDFCIGEEQVEKVFRELLNESELIEPTLENLANEHKNITEIIKKELDRISPDLVKIFERDDVFYKHFRK